MIILIKSRTISNLIVLPFTLCLTYFSSVAQELPEFGHVDTVNVITYKIKGRTATGDVTTKIKVPFVAVSRDLLEFYPLKSKIELLDCPWAGIYKVMDIMGQRHSKTIDIFYTGKRKNQVSCLCRKVE